MLSSIQVNTLNFAKVQESANNILFKLMSTDKNLFTKFRNIFTKIYMEIIGEIKSKMFQLFYNNNNYTKNSDEDLK